MVTFRNIVLDQYCNMKALQLYFNWYGKYSVACCASMITNTPHKKKNCRHLRVKRVRSVRLTGRM